MSSPPPLHEVTFSVLDVPAVVVSPRPGEEIGHLALWMHHLGGTKEAELPVLRRLAAKGCTAVSFDAWQHGERALQPVAEVVSGVLGSFRARMWPLLGRTVLDAMAVLDHCERAVAPGAKVVVGGVSMGGDVAVALAGVDERVRRVATVVATPDWTRPGMTALDEADKVLDQGVESRSARWCYDAFDPISHLERYRRDISMSFDVGGDDRHVPGAHAMAFRDALADEAQGRVGGVRVRVHPGLGHLAAARDQRVVEAALAALMGEDQPEH